jgi:alpha,alpha-trehalase
MDAGAWISVSTGIKRCYLLRAAQSKFPGGWTGGPGFACGNSLKNRNAILAADLCTFQLREYEAMARLAEMLGKKVRSGRLPPQANQLRVARLKHLWFAHEKMFFNVRRGTGKRFEFSPSSKNILPRADARAMISRYLWNPDHMLAPRGIRSLSEQDPGYNNVSMIEPYSNWRGPVWTNSNFLYFVALKRYGFEDEARQLAGMLGRLVLADIQK